MALINQLLRESQALARSFGVKKLKFLRQKKWLTVLNVLEID